jgi:molybdenum cofactor synthesis domain-containing protein
MAETVTSGIGPESAIEMLKYRLAIVGAERSKVSTGRILADQIIADRDSPAADVSAMDGYVIRLSDLSHSNLLPVVGQIPAGQRPVDLPSEGVVKIFTGAVVPSGADLVVPFEDVDECADGIRWRESARRLIAGANIRRRGENARSGSVVLEAGQQLTPASIAAASNFGAVSALMHRRVTVTIIVTGNELLDGEVPPAPWQLRDSNGPTVEAVVTKYPWLSLTRRVRYGDDKAELIKGLSIAIADSDVVILTGGVSKGDHDHVPEVIRQIGCEVVFHRLAIRPGQPVLGAVGPMGQLILGLPGNPVSTACCLVRIGIPLMAYVGGHPNLSAREAKLRVSNPDPKSLPLHWMRLVRRSSSHFGEVELIANRGSGDLVALARSDGFIEQAPGESGAGPWDYYSW